MKCILKNQLLKLQLDNKSVELPVLIIPGVHPNVVAVAVGYGRQSADKTKETTSANIGRAAAGAGFNTYPLVSFDGTVRIIQL